MADFDKKLLTKTIDELCKSIILDATEKDLDIIEKNLYYAIDMIKRKRREGDKLAANLWSEYTDFLKQKE